MSIFSQKNLGLSDSLVNAVRSVNEGQQKYKVSGRAGTKASRYLDEATTTVTAKSEREAGEKVMEDYNMKGVSLNDLVVERGEFQRGNSQNLDEEVKTAKLKGYGEDFDQSDEDFEDAKFLGKEKTGMKSSEGPTHIDVYVNKDEGKTFIEPIGEDENSPPFYFEGSNHKMKDIVKHINKIFKEE